METTLESLPVSRTHPASRIVYRDRDEAVVVRPLGFRDAEAIATAIRASLAELKRFMVWAHADNSVAAQLERLKRVEAEYREGSNFGMGIFDEASGAFLGGLGLHPCARLNPCALELGYWIASAYTRKGYATIASRIAIVYAFELLGCDRLQVLHDEANVASRRVIEKCGFRLEGKLRNELGKPSETAIAGGFVAGRRVSWLYALIPEDRSSLDWYRATLERMSVENLAGHPIVFPA